MNAITPFVAQHLANAASSAFQCDDWKVRYPALNRVAGMIAMAALTVYQDERRATEYAGSIVAQVERGYWSELTSFAKRNGNRFAPEKLTEQLGERVCRSILEYFGQATYSVTHDDVRKIRRTSHGV